MVMISFPPEHFAGKKVTVMGLGSFGGQIAVVKYLVNNGADVIVTDLAPPERLKKALKELEGLDNITYHLGGHIEADFTDVDLIVVSPAVPKDSRYLKLAVSNNIPIVTEMNIFLDRCPAKTIGITGTVGKSTTASMVDAILREAYRRGILKDLGYRRHWFGGNIGKSLLLDLHKIKEDDIVLLELSSFQLEDVAAIEYSPNIAVVLNIYPNHLDRHGKMENYIEAKANITRYQQPDDILIVNADDNNCRIVYDLAPEQVKKFMFGMGKREELIASLDDDGNLLVHDDSGIWQHVLNVGDLNVPGGHNLLNALAACSVATVMGIDRDCIRQALKGFKGVEDRLEYVACVDGVKWYNDSKSTTPQAGIVALRSFDAGKIIAIVGGYDKGIDLTDFAKELALRTYFTITIGQTGRTLAEAVVSFSGKAEYVESLERAVKRAAELAREGFVVLFSPGCASWDMFTNYQERGRQFKKLVSAIASDSSKRSKDAIMLNPRS